MFSPMPTRTAIPSIPTMLRLRPRRRPQRRSRVASSGALKASGEPGQEPPGLRLPRLRALGQTDARPCRHATVFDSEPGLDPDMRGLPGQIEPVLRAADLHRLRELRGSVVAAP